MSAATTSDSTFDVAIVGYGPVGRMLALLLGRVGRRVVVLERQQEVYPLPRAVHFDDEIARIFQSVGLPPDQLPDTVAPYDDLYEWRNADGETLVRLDWRGRGPAGWHVSNFFHQPALENRMRERVDALASVEVRHGWRVVSHEKTADGVHLATENLEGISETVHARWVVGTDGANSLVRSWLDTTTTDLGYFHDWLVVDLVTDVDEPFRPPAWQLCDPARPTTLVPGGPGRRRFEFMRLPEEKAEDLTSLATIWQLLAPWGITPENADLHRHVLYTFQARWCDQWRRGRLLIAGDAAHLMPPFAGQGMCSGLRDAVNLAWKLDLVLTNRAPEELLDTYESERAEHVRHFIAASMELGEIICIADPDAARERDVSMAAALAAGTAPPPRPLPRLGPGLHLVAQGDPGAGTLAVQGRVGTSSGQVLLDDALDSSGYLLLDDPELEHHLDEDRRRDLGELGVAVVALDDAPAAGRLVDTDGVHRGWLAELGVRAALVRADYYVYGTATNPEEVAALADAFVRAITHTPTSEGVREFA